MPKISVIVPVYNVEPYIHHCVDSILGQSFKDFDLILVDDGSPDNCGKICDEYAKIDNRVRVIHQENGGLSAARNAGIDWAFGNSSSKWITFIDSDDFIHPQMLETLIYAAETECVDISVGLIKNAYSLSVETTPLNKSLYSIKTRDEYWHMAYEGPPYAPQIVMCVAKLYNKDFISKLRFKEGKTHEDVFWVSDYAQKINNVAIYTQDVYFYYQREESITGTATPKSIRDELDATLYKTKISVLKFPFFSNDAKKSFIERFFVCAYTMVSKHPNNLDVVYDWLSSNRVEIKALTRSHLTLGQRLFLSFLPLFSVDFFLKILDYRLDVLKPLMLKTKKIILLITKTLGKG